MLEKLYIDIQLAEDYNMVIEEATKLGLKHEEVDNPEYDEENTIIIWENGDLKEGIDNLEVAFIEDKVEWVWLFTKEKYGEERYKYTIGKGHFRNHNYVNVSKLDKKENVLESKDMTVKSEIEGLEYINTIRSKVAKGQEVELAKKFSDEELKGSFEKGNKFDEMYRELESGMSESNVISKLQEYDLGYEKYDIDDEGDDILTQIVISNENAQNAKISNVISLIIADGKVESISYSKDIIDENIGVTINIEDGINGVGTSKNGTERDEKIDSEYLVLNSKDESLAYVNTYININNKM